MIEVFIKSITGDKFASPVKNLTASVFDLFNGRSSNLSVSLIGEAINLGEESVFIAPNLTSSNPWSRNETSLPPALVPLTVLIRADNAVSPGVMWFIKG